MKSVYSSPHLFWVVHYKNILLNYGIHSFVKNEYLSGGAGELPPTECWPRLYVDEDEFDRAQQIVDKEMKTEQSNRPPWRCQQCNEENEAQFEVCWNCGAENVNVNKQDDC